MSKSDLPMFSSRSFVVSSLTFRSLIHLEFLFVYGVRDYSNLKLLCVAVQYSQHHWRDCLFSIVYSCILCHRLIDYKCVGLFLGFLSCSIDLCVCFIPVPYCFDDCSFVVESKVREHDSFSEKYKKLMKEIEEDKNK